MAKLHLKSIDMEGCIESTRLLLGVAKYKEYNASQQIKSKIACVMSALKPHAYSWASPNSRSTQTNTTIIK